jgi:hypothetical protein
MTEQKRESWQERIAARNIPVWTPLESLDGEYHIMPQKIPIEVYKQILYLINVKIPTGDDLKEEEISKIGESLEKELTDKTKKNNIDIEALMKLSFLHGVKDHDFDQPVYKKINGEIVKDENGQPIKEGFEKCKWDEDLYNQIKIDNGVIMEIGQIVMKFNVPPKKKK